MDRFHLYHDIAMRTQGDIYIGVVGPVRTGKSTFIKRFVDLLVLPNIDNEHVRARVNDELPQSGAGRTIMTTQPKFVPNEAVRLDFQDGGSCNVRLVDCVGYLVPGAAGHMDGEKPRMVRTPWHEEDVPFEEAAELGTRKVITEHSTIGVVMTTDGTITELRREAYIEAEERVVAEVRATGRPYVIVVNSADPEGERAVQLAQQLSERYDACVMAMDVMHMSHAEAAELIRQVLLEFPLRQVCIRTPSFLSALPEGHDLIKRILLPISSAMPGLNRMRDYQYLLSQLQGVEDFRPASLEALSLGEGTAILNLEAEAGLFYRVLGEVCGCEIKDECELFGALRDFVLAKSEFDRILPALNQARQTGYGMVPPAMDEMELMEPEILQQGGRFGVRLNARASGLHIIRVDVGSEVHPIVGTEQQSAALVEHLTATFEKDPAALWQTDIFGKSLYDMVRDGMQGKVNALPDEVRMRLRETLERIVNEGCNGLICIML